MTIATFSDRTATLPQTAATNAAGTAIIEAQHVGRGLPVPSAVRS